MKFKELFDSFITMRRPFIKETTLSAYIAHSRRWFGRLQDCEVSEIGTAVLQQLVAEEVEAGLKRKTISDTVQLVKTVLNWGARMYDIPIKKISVELPSLAKQGTTSIEFFTPEQVKKIMTFAADSDKPADKMLALFFTTGLRIGEGLGLRFSDIDFQKGTITVNRTVGRRGSIEEGGHTTLYVNTPKTPTSHREIPLVKWLLTYYKYASKINKPDNYLCSFGGTFIEPRLYRTYYRKILQELEIPYLHPHCMRHTFASTLIRKGCDVKTVSSLLGHTDATITLNVYTHTSDNSKKRAISMFNQL